MAGSPGDPNGIYSLDWESQNVPPTDWREHKTAQRKTCNDTSIRLSDPAVGEPSRVGRRSVRFDLCSDDADAVKGGNKRAELSSSPIEQINAERWYGFSIYLDIWNDDPLPDSVTQWHQATDNGVPPLAICTVNGYWMIAEKDWTKPAANETINHQLNIRHGSKNWTDWVVHVIWRSDNTGLVQIWKDCVLVYERRNGQTSYANQGNYIKIGIYKWPWGQGKVTPGVNRRVMYHDELKISKTGTPATVRPVVKIGNLTFDPCVFSRIWPPFTWKRPAIIQIPVAIPFPPSPPDPLPPDPPPIPPAPI